MMQVVAPTLSLPPLRGRMKVGGEVSGETFP